MKRLWILLVLILMVSTICIPAFATETPLDTTLAYYENNNTVNSYEEALALALLGNKIDGQAFVINPDPTVTGLGDDDSVSTLSKTILFAKACGEDVSEFAGRDAVALLAGQQDGETGSFGYGIYDTYIAILALDAAGAEYDAEAAIAYMLSQQDEGGAYGYYDYVEPYAFVSDPDTTAMMILPLANHKDMDGVESSLAKATDYLLSAIDETTGGYIASWSGKENVSTAACAITAFTAAGCDMESEKILSLKESLLSFQNSDGSFTKDKETEADTYDAFSTSQALMALACLEKGTTPYSVLNENLEFTFDSVLPPVEEPPTEDSPSIEEDGPSIEEEIPSNPQTGDVLDYVLPVFLVALCTLSAAVKEKWQA